MIFMGVATGFVFQWMVGKSRDGFTAELSADVTSLRTEVRKLHEEIDKERASNRELTIQIAGLEVRIVGLEGERDQLQKMLERQGSG